MNKLQKLSESGIEFTVSYSNTNFEGRWVLKRPSGFERTGVSKTFNDAINDLWNAAKEIYTNADSFKNEEKSNFEKWKDFFNDLPAFMCDRFCEVLAKKFDQAGFDVELILECFKEEK